jgi:hypothetical protein
MTIETEELYNLLESLYGGNLSVLEANIFSELVHWVEKKSNVAFLTPEEFKAKMESIPLEKRISLISQLEEMKNVNKKSVDWIVDSST